MEWKHLDGGDSVLMIREEIRRKNNLYHRYDDDKGEGAME